MCASGGKRKQKGPSSSPVLAENPIFTPISQMSNPLLPPPQFSTSPPGIKTGCDVQTPPPPRKPLPPTPVKPQDSSPPPPVKPKLLRLNVIGAIKRGDKEYWHVVNDRLDIQVRAITEPNDGSAWNQLVWNQAAVQANNAVSISRSAVNHNRVTARLGEDPQQFVVVDVYDLTSLSCPLPIKLNDRDQHWKAYESNDTVVLKATTDPDASLVWSLLRWTEGEAGTHPDERNVKLSPARDVHVTASLGSAPGAKTLAADIHICKWPKLEVHKITFDSRSVMNDGTSQIGKEFDKMWIKGRPEPGPNQATASCQSVLRYPRTATVSIEVEFDVIEKPTDEEDVWVRAQAKLGGTTLTWQTTVTVKPADSKVTMAMTASDNGLPDQVGCYDPLTLEWSQGDADNKKWVSIGTTTHLLYVTLDERTPGHDPYWTLLDISCRAAAGTNTEAAFVPAAFAPFQTHTGDGKGFPRKGDAVKLSYYNKGSETDYDDPALPTSPYTTSGILTRSDGTGRCGGWAALLLHMFNLHGITSGGQLWFLRQGQDPKQKIDFKRSFLVRNCDFIGNGTLPPPYCYKGNVECKKLDGAAGQGKTNPQFTFADHVVVVHGGKIYDPSYGVGPVATQVDYEQRAIAGLSYGWPWKKFTQSDGTPQEIPPQCGPGHISHTAQAGQTMADIATLYGVASAAALFNHSYNAALKLKLKGDMTKIQANDVVYIPRSLMSGQTLLVGH